LRRILWLQMLGGFMGLLNMGRTPRPICDVCNHKVDTMDVLDDPALPHVIVRVECHGATEEYLFQRAFLKQLNRDSAISRVFVTKRLEDKPPVFPARQGGKMASVDAFGKNRDEIEAQVRALCGVKDKYR
jgi:hypothetical protein